MRTSKTVHDTSIDQTSETKYYYDSDNKLIAIYGLFGNIMHFYYDADGKINSMSYAGEMYYYVTNLQGDVTKLIKSDGTVAANYEYDAWGKLLTVTNANGSTIGSSLHIGLMNPLRYRGYVYDDETGLYYLQSRYYDPTTGRFVNADGYFQSGGNLLDANMSAYCGNNPVNFSDPTGQYTVCPIHGDSYSQPNCVYCHPSFQEAEDRYNQILKDRENGKKSQYIGSIDTGQKVYVTDDKDVTPINNNIYIVDMRNNKDPNMQVVDSWTIGDDKLQNEVIELMQIYNKENPVDPPWVRTNESMNTEWDLHNLSYVAHYKQERSGSVDFNNADEGKGFFDFFTR